MQTRTPAPCEDVAPALALEERQAQQHDHERRELERMLDERLRDLEWRVGYDGPAVGRYLLLRQEGADKVQAAVVVNVRGGDPVTVLRQDTHHCAAGGGRLP